MVKSVVGPENVVEMTPNRSNNYCCGGGGGAVQSGKADSRRQFGTLKLEQILATGAQYCIAPCHNCHSQISDLSRFHGAGFRVVHLWTLICLSMGILDENERIHLGPELKTVGLPS